MRIDRQALGDLAIGAAFLGSGGGGDPYYSLLLGQAKIAKSGDFRLIPLDTLPDDALIAPCGWIGAPTVSAEKLPNGQEALLGLRELERIHGRPIDAVMAIEIGGGNGLAPLLAAAELGIPVVDADGMGRAFPESQMAVFSIDGLSACPSVVTSASGAMRLIETDDNLEHERQARALSIEFGGNAHMVEYPLTGAMAKRHAIGGSVSAAIAIGAAVRTARANGGDPFEALYRALRGTGLYPAAGTLFEGKIVDLERETTGGFSVGRMVIEGFGGEARMEVTFQNENLIARVDGQVRAMVPDLITVMDSETADSIVTERLKFGQRVRLVGAAAPAVLRTERALKVVGPAAFGYADPYRPIEDLNDWNRG